MNKRPPVYRICVVNRKTYLRDDLFRICKTNEGVKIDLNYKLGGRGVYLFKDLKSIKTAHDKKLLSRALRAEVKDDIFLELISLLGKERRG